jgi:ATP/maltotriose-dependent transcriptional regulator MalT
VQSERQLIARWQAQQGWLLHLQGQMQPAQEHFQQALAELAPETWPTRLLCLSGLTQQALLRSEFDVAQAFNREALCLARAQGALLFEGLLELDHAQLLEQRGAPARAETLLAGIHELLIHRAERPTPLLGRIALRRGGLALCMGQAERAAELFHRGLEDCLRSHDKRVLFGYLGQARIAANRADYAYAFERLREAERLMQQRHIPDSVYRGVLLQVSSELWLQQGRPELAHEALSRVLCHYQPPNALQAPPATVELIPRIEYLLVLAKAYLRRIADPLDRLQSMLDEAYQRGAVTLQVQLHFALAEVALLLNETALAHQHAEQGLIGVQRSNLQALKLHAALRQAKIFEVETHSEVLSELEVDAQVSSLLSQRELQVLMLVASGDSNQQIAEKLFLSLHTVKTHVRRIYGKLGVERRTHAVAKARLLGISI